MTGHELKIFILSNKLKIKDVASVLGISYVAFNNQLRKENLRNYYIYAVKYVIDNGLVKEK